MLRLLRAALSALLLVATPVLAQTRVDGRMVVLGGQPLGDAAVHASTDFTASTFMPSGTGAVAYGVVDRLRQEVLALDYLPAALRASVIAGTNSTSLCRYLQAAINAAGAQRLPLDMKGYAYQCNGTLTADFDGFVIRGGVQRGATLVTNSPSADQLVIGNGATYRYGAIVENLAFTSSAVRSSGVGLRLEMLNNSRVRNVYGANAFVLVQVEGPTSELRLFEIRSDNATPATGCAVRILGGSEIYLTDVLAQGDLNNRPRCGVEVTAASGIYFVHAQSIGAVYGLLIDPGADQTVENFWRADCVWDFSTQDGVLYAPAGTGLVQRVTTSNEWASTGGGSGHHYAGSGPILGVLNSNSRLQNNALDGATLENVLANGITYTNSVMAGNSGALQGSAAGIHVFPGVKNFSFTLNDIGATNGFTNQQGGGIVVDPGPSDGYVIEGNRGHNNTRGTVIDGGTGVNKYVVGNLNY